MYVSENVRLTYYVIYMLIFLKRPALKSNGSSHSEAYSHIDSKVVPLHAVNAYGGLIGSATLTLYTIGGGGGREWSSSCSCPFITGKAPP
jgi:hypothetical protein